MRRRNKLVVLEGIDGVGKTTVAKEIKKFLKKNYIKSIIYESVEKDYSRFYKLRSFIKETPVTVSYLFYLASAVYKSYVLKKLLQNSWVICDRYFYSTIASHKARGSKLKIEIKNLQLLKPDYAFFLTVEEKIRRERVGGRKSITHNDRIKKVPGSLPYKMEKNFRNMKLVKIDNSGTLKETLGEIKKIIDLK